MSGKDVLVAHVKSHVCAWHGTARLSQHTPDLLIVKVGLKTQKLFCSPRKFRRDYQDHRLGYGVIVGRDSKVLQ